MNKNGEKEKKRSKGQTKDSKLPRVNKPRGTDNKVIVAEKAGEADDISNKFPNFSNLTEEERLVFFEALTAARKNVERKGVPTRDRFGTVHDEYLKYFNQDKKEEASDDLTLSLKSNCTVKDGVNSLSDKSMMQFESGEPSQKPSEQLTEEKSLSLSLMLEGGSETPREGSGLVTIEPGLLQQCESVIQEDTNKMLGLYLKKKKRNEAKSIELQTNKKPDPIVERKTVKPAKKEKTERECKRKENAWAMQVSGPASKPKETPRFDELNAQEKQVFFEILQNARKNIVDKNLGKKTEILPMDAIMRRYKCRQATASPDTGKLKVGKTNLKLKVNLTSGDNERIQRQTAVKAPPEEEVECEENSEAEEEGGAEQEDEESSEKGDSDKHQPHPKDVGSKNEAATKADKEHPGAKEDDKPSNVNTKEDTSRPVLEASSDVIDLKMSPGMDNVRNAPEGKTPSLTNNEMSADKKNKGRSDIKTSSYFIETQKPFNSQEAGIEDERTLSNLSKSGKARKVKKMAECEKEEKQEEMGDEESQESLSELSEVLNEEKCSPEKEGEEEGEEEEEEEEEEDSEKAEEPSVERPDRESQETCILEKNPERSSCEANTGQACLVADGETEEAEERKEPEKEECTCGQDEKEEEEEDGEEDDEEEEDEEVEEEEASEEESKKEEEAKNEKEKEKEEDKDGGSVKCPNAGKRLPQGWVWPWEERVPEKPGKMRSLSSEAVGEKPERANRSMNGVRSWSSDAVVQNCCSEEEEVEESGSESLGSEEFRDDGEMKELVSMCPKVMIVDDNVVERIRNLIYYLEAKTGKEGRLEKEYIKLLVDYVDYLSKVLEALVQKKNPRTQVQTAYSAKIKTKDGITEDPDMKWPMHTSVSKQRFASTAIMPMDEKSDKTTDKGTIDGISASVFPMESETTVVEEEVTYHPPSSSTKKLVATKIRLLQDLLKKRAQFVHGSADELKIVHFPQEQYVPEKKPVTLKIITEEDEENMQKGGNKFLKFLIGCFTCGTKKDEEDGIFQNLKGEAVRVDVCEGKLKNSTNATLNQATMEVLNAAGRKKIIEKYYKN